MVQMNPVNSSNVQAIGYDADKKKLRVAFHNGSVYDYHDVPQEAYDASLTAESVGKYLNTHIKPKYGYEKV